MIKIDKENVEIVGNGPLVLAELSTLVHSLHYGFFIGEVKIPPEKSREMIQKAVEKGFLSDDEIAAEAEKAKKECLVDILDKLKDLLTGKDDE